MTTPDQQQRIQELAYQLWEQEGRPTGREREHWEQARQALQGNAPEIFSEATQPEFATRTDNTVLTRPQPTPGVVKDGQTGRSARTDADVAAAQPAARPGAGAAVSANAQNQRR